MLRLSDKEVMHHSIKLGVRARLMMAWSLYTEFRGPCIPYLLSMAFKMSFDTTDVNILDSIVRAASMNDALIFSLLEAV
jgi:hypothetical protein